ncbi:MAG: hypothetical protein WCL39_08415 [Armatimonadota bacterium]
MTPRAAYYSAQYTSTVLDDVTPDRAANVTVLEGGSDSLQTCVWRNGKGERLIGLWHTTSAVDTFQPKAVTIRIDGTASEMKAYDLLYGTQQTIRTEPGKDGMIIRDLMIGDWPVVLRY